MAVRIAMGCQIGALPYTPFASSRRSPQGETRSMERKNRESYISCTIPQFPPLVVNAVSQSPECVSSYMSHKANPVTLTLIICGEAATVRRPQPSGRSPSTLTPKVCLKPIHLKNLFSATLLYNLPASAGHNLRAAGPSTLRTLFPARTPELI